jgi:hypothetical protein
MEDGSPIVDVTPLVLVLPILVCLFNDWRAARAEAKARRAREAGR